MESLVELAKIWLDAEGKVAGLEGHVPGDSIKLLESYYACLFGDIMDRDFPLRPLEFRDLHRQLDRFHDMAQLFERQSTRRNHATQALLQLPDSKMALDRALKILQDVKPYDAVQRDEFKFALWVSNTYFYTFASVLEISIKISEYSLGFRRQTSLPAWNYG